MPLQPTQLPSEPGLGTGVPLAIASISSSAGPTAGGSYLTIVGAGFQLGTTVALAGVKARIYYATTTELRFTTHPHVAGVVDLVVSTPDGRAERLAGGYTYVAPQFSRFDGVWEGRLGDETETQLSFTVQNNTLVRMSCGTIPAWSISISTTAGEFALAGDSGSFTGGLVAADYAVGTISLPACTTYATAWFATTRR